MNRRKPYSGKKKKQYLQEKRAKKANNEESDVPGKIEFQTRIN